MDNLKDIIKKCEDLTLLYIEDNEESRRSSIGIFEEFFQNIILAVDGIDGLDKLEKNKVDIIITDINMPHMDGLTMIEKIKEVDKTTPIIILSAHNEAHYLLESIKLAIDGFMLKPLQMESFLSTLDKVSTNLYLKKENQKYLNFLNQYQEITDKSSIVSKTDPDGIITYVNEEFCNISGYTKSELIGQNHNIVRHPENSTKLFENLWDTIKDKKQIWSGILKNITKDGSSYYVKSTIKPILDENGEIIEYIALRVNISDVMNHKKQIIDLVDTLENPLVVLVQIEDFKDIESFFGHKLSDEIQEEFSKHLLKLVPKACDFKKVFMLDEGKFAFAKNMDHCEAHEKEVVDNIKMFQEDVHDKKINIKDLDYDLSIIVSLAYGEDALENAQYGLKLLEKTQKSFILSNHLAKKEHDKAEENIRTLQVVKNALNNNQIVSYFQPIIDNKTKEIIKYESLARLIDESGKVLTPYYFLDIAKKGKYYTGVTSAILDNSFEALKNTYKNITINLSAIDIEDRVVREKIYKLLDEHKGKASHLVFELLEDENIKDFDTIKDFIANVKKLGVKIAIDDFGSGYSNFEKLLDFQPDILKIDGSLIKNINNDKSALLTVKTIVSLAKELNIKTTAEFVENEEIFNIVCELGIDYSQGYYFGKPEPLG